MYIFRCFFHIKWLFDTIALSVTLPPCTTRCASLRTVVHWHHVRKIYRQDDDNECAASANLRASAGEAGVRKVACLLFLCLARCHPVAHSGPEEPLLLHTGREAGPCMALSFSTRSLHSARRGSENGLSISCQAREPARAGSQSVPPCPIPAVPGRLKLSERIRRSMPKKGFSKG